MANDPVPPDDLTPDDDLPLDDSEGDADGPWGPEFEAEIAAHDNLSPHPLRAKIEKMLNGMDAIRAMYPTPEARAEEGIAEEGWQRMEANVAKIRELYPTFVADDDAVIEHMRRATLSRDELAQRRAGVNEAFAALGILFN